MNKPVDPKKPSEVVGVDAPQVPAMPKPPSKWKKFRRLMNDLDEIRERHDDMADLMGDLRHRKSGEPPPDIRDAQLDDYDKQQIARCRQWLPDIDRVDYYEKGDEDEGPILKKKIISERLALMLGAVHIGGPQTPEAFLLLLLEHVYDAEVSYLALESGCRQIEQTEKYVQAISEVLKVVKQDQEQWNKRKLALRGIDAISNNLQEQIREAQAKYESERAVKGLGEANWRLSNLHSRVKQDVEQIIEAQELARETYRDVDHHRELLSVFERVLRNLHKPSEMLKRCCRWVFFWWSRRNRPIRVSGFARFAQEHAQKAYQNVAPAQERAHQAYQNVEQLMNQLAKDEQQFDEAKAELNAVVAEVKAAAGLMTDEERVAILKAASANFWSTPYFTEPANAVVSVSSR